MRFKRGRAIVALILLLPGKHGFAQGTPEQLLQMARGGNCPSNLTTYLDVTYRQHCGENYMTALKDQEILRCQSEVDAKNEMIREYNDFIRRCRDAVRRQQGGQASTGSQPARPAPTQTYTQSISRPSGALPAPTPGDPQENRAGINGALQQTCQNSKESNDQACLDKLGSLSRRLRDCNNWNVSQQQSCLANDGQFRPWPELDTAEAKPVNPIKPEDLTPLQKACGQAMASCLKGCEAASAPTNTNSHLAKANAALQHLDCLQKYCEPAGANCEAGKVTPAQLAKASSPAVKPPAPPPLQSEPAPQPRSTSSAPPSRSSGGLPPSIPGYPVNREGSSCYYNHSGVRQYVQCP